MPLIEPRLEAQYQKAAETPHPKAAQTSDEFVAVEIAQAHAKL